MSGQTVLITGSNGFLGTFFRLNVSTKNYNYIWGSTSKNKIFSTFTRNYQNINIIKPKNIDVIIHFASNIPQTFNQAKFRNVFLPNIKMMNNLMEYSINNQVKKFIYLSGFGSMRNPELYDIRDFYTLSKITGEHFCSIMEAHGIETASLRISSPYGEYSKSRNVLNIFLQNAFNNIPLQIFGTGKREQNYIYAGDVVRAIELCLNKKVNGIYSIVSEKNVTMLELAENIIKLSRSKSKIIKNVCIDPQEDFRPSYNLKRAKKELNFKPIFTLEAGLKKYINWLRK